MESFDPAADSHAFFILNDDMSEVFVYSRGRNGIIDSI